MSEKTFKGRIVNKHDIESNWQLATNFTPLKGEIILYDPDENHENSRVKIGDGIHNINDLAFYAGSWDDIEGKPFGGYKFTWDGNTEGKDTVLGDGGNVTMCKVSDEIVTPQDLDGAKLTISTGEVIEVSSADFSEKDGAYSYKNSSIVLIPNAMTFAGLDFPSGGVYFMKLNNVFHVAEVSNLQTIDPKYLPMDDITATEATHATSADKATKADTATKADSATKATQDGNGKVIADTYATKTELGAVSSLVGDTAVSTQISNATANHYTKEEIDNYELITIADIDEICGGITEGSLAQSDVDELMAQLQ